MLFLDIDGCIVEFDIQQYVGKIELFGNEPIRDMEYIIKCSEYMFHEAEKNNELELANFIETKVLPFVKNNMLERLKECRDCFLEYDNYATKKERDDYINRYKESSASFKIDNLDVILTYLKKALELAHNIIKIECDKARLESRTPRLPFAVTNQDNDIIKDDRVFDADKVMYEMPVERSISALNRFENMQFNCVQDDLLTVSEQVGEQIIVDYNEIYSPINLTLDVKETLMEVHNLRLFNGMFALSHHTGLRETESKKYLFAKHLPFVEINDDSLMKFHSEQAQMGIRRGRSSKAERAKNIMEKKNGVRSIEGCYLIDDSVDNLRGWADAGGYAILYRPRTKEEVATGIDQKTDPRFVRIYNWSIDELIRAKYEFEGKGKVLKK